MKKVIFSLITFATLFTSCTSCDPGMPTEQEMQNYMSVLSHYYPYSITDTFVFKNDISGEVWEAYPYSLYGGSTYPRTSLSKLDGKTTGWSADIEAPLTTKGLENYHYVGITTTLHYIGGIMAMGWNVLWKINEDETVHGGYIITCSKDQLLSNLTDTILIPIPCQVMPGPPVIAPDEGYARIIKHQGLTDFSIDGKTVWRRVKP